MLFKNKNEISFIYNERKIMNKECTNRALLSEIIQMAKADQVIKESEYGLLQELALQFGIGKDEFENLLYQKPQKAVINSHEERIDQFHRLIRMLYVDGEQHFLELDLLRVMGISIGLKPSTVLKLIQEMQKHPEGNITKTALLEASFKIK